MAEPKRIIEYVPETEEGQYEGLYSDERKAFDDFRESLDADDMGLLRVGKLLRSKLTGNPMHLKAAHCFSCPIDQYSFDELLDVLREKYGGGLYRLIGVKKGTKGSVFNRLVEIAEENVVKDSPKIGGVLESVTSMIMQAQERTEALLTRVSPQATVADPFAMMERVVTMLGSMGLIGGAARGGDLLGEIDKLLKLKELASAFGGGGDSNGADSNFYDLAGKLVDRLGPAFVAAVQAKGASAPATPQLAAPQPETTTPGPAAPQGTSMKSQIDILVANAKNGVTAETMAKTILDMTPDSKLEALYTFVAASDCLDKMAGTNPEVQNHREWFETLRKIIIGELQEPEDSATVPPVI